MLAGIRSRLILSYLLVIIIVVLIAFTSLLILVWPIQQRLIYNQMANELNLLRRPLQQFMERSPSPEQGLATLTERVTDFPNRLLLVNERGEVLFDNEGQWRGKAIPIAGETAPNGMLQGQFRGTDQQRYLYLAQPLRLQQTGGVQLVAVRSAPRLTDPLLQDFRRSFAVAGAIALVAALLLSVFIARWIARPLQHIAQGARAVADGNYQHQVPVRGPREVRQVADAFNDMLTQVQSGQQATRDFVSNVSHELKTPLTSIQGFSQALVDGTAQDDASRQRAASIINEEALRLRRLVDDLLDLARLDTGTLNLSQEPVDLSMLLQTILDKLHPQLALKSQLLEQHIDQLPAVIGDGDRLTQVFTNLLDNAIKHTPPQGTIRVEGARQIGSPIDVLAGSKIVAADAKRQFARISIRDSGPGIAPEEQQRIFERFYQVDRSRHRKGGTGLGLSIAQDIVKMHHGFIRVESIPQRGTQFTVWLPVQQAQASER